ncbi:MAG: nucleotidyltransferase family protein [Anaerolineae bacterium]|nr:nucleotidyltransferase family protein [Anaerolineae bacterium]
MRIEQLLKKERDEILRIAAEYGAFNVRVFGSAARGETGPASDVDLLVDFEEGKSLLDLIGMKQALEDLLGCKVDLVTEDGLHHRIKRNVLDEAVLL